MAAVTPRIGTEHPVLPLEGFRQNIPDSVAGGPAMQEYQRRAFAPDAQMEPFAIIGNEGLHHQCRRIRDCP
jgi:hypothetical protein